MSLLSQEFHQRANLALLVLQASPLPAIVEQEVDAFFTKYSDLERNRLSEAFITSLVLEKLFTAAEPAAQPAERKTAA